MQIVKVRVGAIALMAACALFSCSKSPVDEGKIQISTDSQEAREKFVQGRELADKLRIQDARPLLEQAVALDTNFAQGYWQLSQVQASAAGFFENLERARNHMSSASEGERLLIESTDAGVNGETPRQEEILKRLVQLFPQDERAHNQLGNFYFGQQKWDNAISEYEKAIAIDSSYSQPYNQMGYAYRFTEHFDKAEVAFRKYIELIPDDPNPYDSYAELLLKTGRHDESIVQYEKALSYDPTFGASYVGIATNLDMMGRHEEARARLQQFYDKAEDDGQRRNALVNMAGSYIDEGSYVKALETVEKMFQIASGHGDYSNMSGDANLMGNILLDMGRYDEALKRFEESVVLQGKAENVSPRVVELARFNHQYDAGRVAALSGDIEKAKQLLTSYQQQAESNKNPFQIWQAYQLAGIIAMQEKDWDNAVANLQKANPLNPYNFYLLSVAHSGKGDAENAKAFADKAVNFNGVGNVFQAMARQKIASSTGKV